MREEQDSGAKWACLTWDGRSIAKTVWGTDPYSQLTEDERTQLMPLKVRDKLDLTERTPQIIYCSTRRQDRICLYQGVCVVCWRETYEFVDGDNDPRGVLGDSACQALDDSDDDTIAPGCRVVLCAVCASDEGSYRQGMTALRCMSDRRLNQEAGLP